MRRYSEIDLGLLLLRLGFAALLIGFHGWTRLFRAFNLVVHHQAWPFVGLVQRLGFPYPSVFAVLSALSESVAVAFLAAERGLEGADDYLAQWRWSEEEQREGSAQDVAQAICRELEALADW